MDPWYKVATPRDEVRQGRSFNPDEFAIALEQVVAGTAPEDYRKPAQFFERTVFTRALRDHTGMVLRRLAGETIDTAPVLTLITQFGGGKTHTLTALYHLVKEGPAAARHVGVSAMLESAGLESVPIAQVGVFVGNAWDPEDGRETPWIDLARQLAGDAGVAALGTAALTTPPGTSALTRLFDAAGGSVLVLLDEVLNFVNRHRNLAEPFHAFIQNLSVAMTGTSRGAAVISLPRSQVEMTDWDQQWQERITKVVRRVAKDLIVNDETEVSEVLRRRLFQDLGGARLRRNVATAYADWCFERRAQLPPEWSAVDTATTEKNAREFLRERFERCYPFHPATLSVFQRKWQSLPQYQQTRGTLAMLAQWVAHAYREGYATARSEPLITLGSAPLETPEFRSVVLGQLGESRLVAAIEADIAGEQAHARILDTDTRGALRNIHRRVGTTILFESSGGQTEKVAHLPELRFALGEPEIDTTSVDTAALALDSKAFYVRRVGSDGFKIDYKPKLAKVVSDRRASLDDDAEVRPEIRRAVEKEFERGAGLPLVRFPDDGAAIQDSPRLTLVVADPAWEWSGENGVRERIAEWTRRRGSSDRIYPGALVWSIRKPGRDLRDKVELLLAWRRVQREIREGTLGSEFDRADLADVQSSVTEAEQNVRDEVWAQYRYVALADKSESDGLRIIDLGAGHASAAETLCGRIVAALKTEALLNESVGAGYLDRNWPPALDASGAWPLLGLRQAFVNGTLTRLVDPDRVLRTKIAELVEHGDFGLASQPVSDGGYERVWFRTPVAPDEVAFEPQVFLLKRSAAESLTSGDTIAPVIEPGPPSAPSPDAGPAPSDHPEPAPTTISGPSTRTIHITGTVPTELWNRLGTRIIPKLKDGTDLRVGVEFSVTVDASAADRLESELRQAFEDLGVTETIRIA